MVAEQTPVHDWLGLIRAEYLEMPGLKLTKPQVRRLWRLDPQLCDAVLDELISSDFLEETPKHSYVLSSRQRH